MKHLFRSRGTGLKFGLKPFSKGLPPEALERQRLSRAQAIKARKRRKEVFGTAKKDNSIEERARAAVMPVIEKNGLTLWDVCFEKEGAMWYLRVLVDRDGGLDSDECEIISKPINDILDRQDFIKSVDILEVGSPGLTKKLRKPEHFRACMGEPVRVTRRGEKGKEFSVYGTLTGYDEEKGTITLEDDNGSTEYSISGCVKINSDL